MVDALDPHHYQKTTSRKLCVEGIFLAMQSFVEEGLDVHYMYRLDNESCLSLYSVHDLGFLSKSVVVEVLIVKQGVSN